LQTGLPLYGWCAGRGQVNRGTVHLGMHALSEGL